MPKTDSIESKSSADLKEMLMQTSLPETGEEESQEEEVVATEETEEEETKPEETAEAETEKEVEPKEETEKRYKLKVEGKEEELPLSEVLKYAQQGRYLEKEKAKLNAEKKRLMEGTGKPPANIPPFDPKQANEWFLKEVEANPVGALFNVIDFKDKMNKEAERDEKRKNREYDLEKSEEHGILWKQLKPKYEEFRDLGYPREQASAMAEADFWKDVAANALETGTKKGEKKAKLKQMAEMPSGEKKMKTFTEIPSPKDASKMTSAELRKILRYVKNPEW